MSIQTYYIKGMHCASCELLIEKKLLEFAGVKSVDASLVSNAVTVEYNADRPSLKKINQIFAEHGYQFAYEQFADNKEANNPWVVPGFIAAVLIFGFLWLDKLGLALVVNISSASTLPTFFIFGLIAGVSSCAALVGGLVLSLSKGWMEKYGSTGSLFSKSAPHLMFNIGRVISYGIFGAVLGLLGGALRLSQNFTSLLVVAVSVIMVILALQMLGVHALDHFRFALPKSVTRKIAGGKTGPPAGGKAGPFLAGFLTFFLPCGFTLIAQGAAVLSGGALRGGLIMAAFALGTFIPLMIIGLSSTKLLSNEKWSQGFLKVAGLLVLFFVAYNLNVQFNITRYFAASGNQANNQIAQPIAASSTTTAGDVQVLKTIYTSQNDIQPATFTVKVGQKVRMEVDVRDNGSGCMSTIMVPGLYNQVQYLQKGQILVMEFIPEKVGDYQITCAMGVPRGIIKVIN